MSARSEHQRITEAGWSYRTNDRGWIIYWCPETGLWHTRAQALELLGISPDGTAVEKPKVRHAHQSD